MTARMIGLTFFSPWMVWTGIAMAAVPVIIHLLNRRRFKVIPWAAMEFLLAAVQRNRRRLQFERWLLLAMRCGVLILLGLALARPMGCDTGASWAGAQGVGRGLNVILLDNSYSMAYKANRPQAETHFDQARRLAGGLIDGLGAGGQSVALITTARPAVAVLSPPTFDLDQAHAVLGRIPQTAAATDMPAAMQLALDLAEHSNEPTKNLFILTDATRSAFEGINGETEQRMGALAEQLSSHYRITIFNLGLEQQANRAIVNLSQSGELATTSGDVEFHATVAEFGPPRSTEARWMLEGRAIGVSPLHQWQGAGEILSPPVKFTQIGPQVITLQLASDGMDHLGGDDRYWQVVDVVSKLDVLLVEGERGLTPMSGSAAFLKLALSPPDSDNAAGSSSDVETTGIGDLELPNQVLKKYRAVILADVPRLDPAQAVRLSRFVKQGGAVLWFMGRQVDAESYNKILLPLGLIPGPLTHVVASGSQADGFLFGFNPEGAVDPFLEVFKHQRGSGLDTARIFSYWQIQPQPQWHARRILNYRPAGSPPEGQLPDPAITVHALGRGRVIFFSTSANADWTSLPAKPAYVALVNELLRHGITSSGQWMNLQVGQRLELPASIELSATPTLMDPKRRPMSLVQTTVDGQVQYQSPPLNEPGLYDLRTGSHRYPVAVNVPAADEADIRTLNAAALRRVFGNIPMEIYGDQLPSQAAATNQPADWSRPLMFMLLMLIAMEGYMALRSGHYRRPQSAGG